MTPSNSEFNSTPIFLFLKGLTHLTLFSFKRVLSLARTIPVAKPTVVWKLTTTPALCMNHFQYLFINLSWHHCPFSSPPLFKSFSCTLLGTVRFQKSPSCRFWYCIFLSCLLLAMFFSPYRNLVTEMIIVFGILFPME